MDSSYAQLLEEWKKVASNILQPMKIQEPHVGKVNVVVSTPKYYFSAGEDNLIYQFNIKTDAEIHVYKKHLSPIHCLQIQDKYMISGDENGLLVCWNIQKRDCSWSQNAHTNGVTAIHIDRNFHLFTGGNDNMIYEWDIETGKQISRFEGHTAKINQLYSTFNKNPILFSCSDDNFAYCWDCKTRKKSVKFAGHKDSVLCLFYDELSRVLFTGSADKTVFSWDIRKGSTNRKYIGNENAITQIHVNQSFLFTCCKDGRLGVIKIKASKRDTFTFLEGHKEEITNLIVLPDRMITSSLDNTIRLWRHKSSSSKVIYEGHTKGITTISMNPEQILISGGKDSKVIRWPKVEIKSRSGSIIVESKEQKEAQYKDYDETILHNKISLEKVSIWVNDKQHSVPGDLNIIEACRYIGVPVHSLCYHPRLHPLSTCKCCAVEVETGLNNLRKAGACATIVKKGMKIYTDTITVKDQQRQAILELRLKQRSRALLSKGETFDDSTEFGRLLRDISDIFIDDSNKAIRVDLSKCIDCARCAQVCKSVQKMGVISFPAKSINAIETAFRTNGKYLIDTQCIACGQCSVFCPTGAISEYDNTPEVERELESGGKTLVVGIAPSVRVTLSEEFGKAPGEISAGKFASALRMLGFQYVFDVQFFADLTIMEEGSELLKRLKDPDAVLPMFTSCCPAWINMVEKLYPELIPHLSSAKSPQQMFGAIVKSYFAKKIKVKRKDIYCVSIMPCTAKKQELRREQMQTNGIRDVDVSLTVREIARMFKKKNIDWEKIVEGEFDDPLGTSSSSGSLFAATGGVMEAALRTAYEIETGEIFPKLTFQEIRGLEKFKLGEVTIKNKELQVGVLNSGAAIHDFIHKFKKGDLQTAKNEKISNLIFVEFMACPGGCIGGGGQPRSSINILPQRIEAVYNNEFSLPFRKSHDNEKIKELYSEFLKEPLSEKSEELLHTRYKPNQRHEEAEVHKSTDTLSIFQEGLIPKNSVLVLFGSQTGTAELAAIKITQNLLKAKIKARLVEMNHYKVGNLISELFVIFVTSTFWEGSFPENAIEFWNDLQKLTTRLRKLRFAIFGLGNSTYAHFNHAGQLLQSQMQKLGAIEMHDFGRGDCEAVEGYLTELKPWIETLVKVLHKNIPKDMRVN
ncbi:iron hydrogenase [Anaeramoeba ignava]|uniref:Iron hydrogenase n=1 Tax=Anaeramoeba ignava TaxID=1746090 RepID=A0A9Q0LB95_ANAIG|nr:iron hydrogenase [Anaeramoeba ignava]